MTKHHDSALMRPDGQRRATGRASYRPLYLFFTSPFVTPGFKGKTECIDHVCARIKLHTHLDIMNTKNSATRIKSYYKP
jgi:hypothetical protein